MPENNNKQNNEPKYTEDYEYYKKIKLELSTYDPKVNSNIESKKYENNKKYIDQFGNLNEYKMKWLKDPNKDNIFKLATY